MYFFLSRHQIVILFVTHMLPEHLNNFALYSLTVKRITPLYNCLLHQNMIKPGKYTYLSFENLILHIRSSG